MGQVGRVGCIQKDQYKVYISVQECSEVKNLQTESNYLD